MTILGQISLWLALLLAVWAVVVGFLGGKSGRPELIQSARRSVYALAAVLVVASATKCGDNPNTVPKQASRDLHRA